MKLIFLNKMVSDNWFHLIGNSYSLNYNYLDKLTYIYYIESEYISNQIHYWVNVKAQGRYIVSGIKEYRYED